MKPLRYILPLLLPLLLSCVRESSRGDAFEASFTLDTETVYNGDEFAFTIRCNRSSFRILSFEFPLAPGAIQPYTLCPTRDGAWSFRERVSVTESGKGRIALVIEDPDTGLQKEFSADYTAYASTGVNLIIENERVTSKYLPHGLPAVIGGDDFRFTLHGRPQRLILEAFECEFNDSTLVEGMELLLPEGDTTFCIPSVQAGDAFSPRTLSLTFRSLDSGRDTTLSATYVTAAPFVSEATLVDSHLIEGEKGTLRLRANRERFELREYAAPSWFILDGWSADDPGVNLNMEGYAAFTTKALAIDESGAGTSSSRKAALPSRRTGSHRSVSAPPRPTRQGSSQPGSSPGRVSPSTHRRPARARSRKRPTPHATPPPAISPTGGSTSGETKGSGAPSPSGSSRRVTKKYTKT